MLSIGLALGLEPVAGFEDPIDREGIDRFVVLEIAVRRARRRAAGRRERRREPARAGSRSFLDAGDERPDPRDVHLLDRDRLEPACARKAGRSRSDLKPMCTVNGEIARSSQASRRIRAAEVVEEDDAAARPADAAHLARDGDRIGNDADHIRRVDDVERPVGELEIGGVHLDQADVARCPLRAMRSRAFSSIGADRSMPVTEQSRGYSDALMPVPDADFEHAIAGGDAHPLNRLHAAGVQRRPERPDRRTRPAFRRRPRRSRSRRPSRKGRGWPHRIRRTSSRSADGGGSNKAIK